MKKTKFHSIAIPNTLKHVAFINEVKLALKVAKILYTTEIVENYVEQFSEVSFYTKTQKDCDNLAALVELVSNREDTPRNLGLKFKALHGK